MNFQISRSEILLTIPERKIIESLKHTLQNCDDCSKSDIQLTNACPKCICINKAKNRYAKSNIPVRYWDLHMNKHFKGDEILSNTYKTIIQDISSTYKNGKCLCFAGNHGTGKTLTCCNILKRAAEKGYNCLYVTLTDIVELIVSPSSEDKYVARKELLMVDFLVIDEFDPRYMRSSSASELFGNTLENIFRTRSQNSLPLFMCTNSPNVIESFQGPIKESINSLMHFVEIVPVLGDDFRKNYTV